VFFYLQFVNEHNNEQMWKINIQKCNTIVSLFHDVGLFVPVIFVQDWCRGGMVGDLVHLSCSPLSLTKNMGTKTKLSYWKQIEVIFNFVHMLMNKEYSTNVLR
jgi:hypothetical protein